MRYEPRLLLMLSWTYFSPSPPTHVSGNTYPLLITTLSTLSLVAYSRIEYRPIT